MKTTAGTPVSRMGMGTYLGHLSDATDAQMLSAMRQLMDLGVCHFDTAPNYRAQRSEAVLGLALAESGRPRSDFFVATKVGFLPFDRSVPQDPKAWIQEQFVDTGLVSGQDILGGTQCFAPAWIEYQLSQSLSRLRTDHVDVLYLHNLESAMAALDGASQEKLCRNAFGKMAELHTNGKIKACGIASWAGFIEEGPGQLSVEQLSRWAHSEGCGSALKFIQAPFSVSMPQALLKATQTAHGKRMSLARATASLGMELISSAPLFHGRLAELDMPEPWMAAFPGFNAAQICLALACAAPGIASTLVGVKSTEHLTQIKAILDRPQTTPETFVRLMREP